MERWKSKEEDVFIKKERKCFGLAVQSVEGLKRGWKKKLLPNNNIKGHEDIKGRKKICFQIKILSNFKKERSDDGKY